MLIFYIYHSNMWIKNTILSIAASASILAWANECVGRNEVKWADLKLPQTEQLEIPQLQDSIASDSQEESKKQIFVCLEKDSPDSYTHTKVLESIEDPENTVLEYPVAQLFEKYWKNNSSHPLKVSWVAPRFRSLLWRWWIEASDTPQKLNPRQNDITSETNYEVWDTLSFRPIDSRLVGAFPSYLKDQLKEEWFETFSDKDSLLVNSPNEVSKEWNRDVDNLMYWDKEKTGSNTEYPNYIYDIVVKSLPWWKSALALYRDGKLFMATYVSIWTSGRKSVTWQFEIISENPYKRSIKYENSPMPLSLQIVWWYYFHQWNVTGNPLSHWCIRMPWVYADLMYSAIRYMVKNEQYSNIDVYIDKNLYKTK